MQSMKCRASALTPQFLSRACQILETCMCLLARITDMAVRRRQCILVFVSPLVTALYRRHSTGPPAIAVKPLAQGVGRFIVKSWLVKIEFCLTS
jgi:hypothetical protein